jgi:ribosomal protein S18 acetylase RimI-like enzyme
MGVAVRAAGKGDIALVLNLWSVGGENASRPDDSAEAVEALIDRDPEALILAEVDGALAGSVIAGWDGWRYHLYRLAVHPDYRRQGVATLLLERGQQRLVGLGALRIDAMVRDDNQLGQSVWVARGYHRQAEWSRWVKESLRSSG